MSQTGRNAQRAKNNEPQAEPPEPGRPYALRLADQRSVAELPADAPDRSDAAKERARAESDALRGRLADWQERLYAEHRRRLLVVLQAMDTGGKDGTIRNVFRSVNAMGVKAARFEAPTRDDLARDYLWRVHAQVPATGQIGIFNRSHYEDVLTVRVNGLVPEHVWRRRYEHIRGFERLLADEGTRIVKLFLHIDQDEQRERLQARVDDPCKRWKFDDNDLSQRKHWDDYMAAYTDAIRETDAPHAPWYVIPANQKWHRDRTVLELLVRTLEDMGPQYPKTDVDPSHIVID
ncbi:MAG: polyphosphate kinase 2 family protein [Burkholderiaceae bacterium]